VHGKIGNFLIFSIDLLPKINWGDFIFFTESIEIQFFRDFTNFNEGVRNLKNCINRGLLKIKNSLVST
jgi:hypothetical protein